MEILNETVYDSGAILHLVTEVHRLCQIKNLQEKAEWQAKYPGQTANWHDTPLPKTLRVGYYGGKGSTLTGERKFASVTGARKGNPRLGIARPTDLIVNVMGVLAEAATGAEHYTVPGEVVQQISRELSYGFKGSLGQREADGSNDNLRWLVANCPLTYGETHDKESAQRSKRAAAQVQIVRLERRLDYAETHLDSLNTRRFKALCERDRLQEKLAKLKLRERKHHD